VLSRDATALTAMARAAALQARRRGALTGTPVKNRLLELRALRCLGPFLEQPGAPPNLDQRLAAFHLRPVAGPGEEGEEENGPRP
jgi:hypothetical protein